MGVHVTQFVRLLASILLDIAAEKIPLQHIYGFFVFRDATFLANIDLGSSFQR